jgi:hypothetical protein
MGNPTASDRCALVRLCDGLGCELLTVLELDLDLELRPDDHGVLRGFDHVATRGRRQHARGLEGPEQGRARGHGSAARQLGMGFAHPAVPIVGEEHHHVDRKRGEQGVLGARAFMPPRMGLFNQVDALLVRTPTYRW